MSRDSGQVSASKFSGARRGLNCRHVSRFARAGPGIDVRRGSGGRRILGGLGRRLGIVFVVAVQLFKIRSSRVKGPEHGVIGVLVAVALAANVRIVVLCLEVLRDILLLLWIAIAGHL